jgi:hypothetical protein
MDSVTTDGLKQLLNKERIKDTLVSYCRGVDRCEWDLVRAAYHEDAYDDHGGYKGNVDGFIEWLERRHQTIEQSMHFIGNCKIDFLSDNVAVAETYCVAYQRYGHEALETIKLWLGDEPLQEGKKVVVELLCRYIDRMECRQGVWKIANRIVAIEDVKAAQQVDRLQPIWALAKRDRSDALWQMLAGSADAKT